MAEAAIQKVRDMIAWGDRSPGGKLPRGRPGGPAGASRNTVREAVRVLVTARVLDVRRGDGSYVTSQPRIYFWEGIGFAAQLMQSGLSIDLIHSWKRARGKLGALVT